MLIDSNNYIHVIGFEPFDPEDVEWDGRIFHIRFNAPLTVTGTYSKEYITEDHRIIKTIETYASYYLGAAIHSDDTMIVAYNNSILWNVAGTYSLGARIYDPIKGDWTYESVATNMSSRHCYPLAFISDDYYHKKS